MKHITIGKHNVEMYDAIDELPIKRFHKFNKMLLIDAGIGSDLADFDTHLQRAIIYAGSKTPQMAITELNNLRQNVWMIQTELSPKHLAFATLVRKIDGVEYEDISDDALKKIIEIFADVPVKEITAPIEAAKKKLDDELQMYFPQIFDDANIKEYFDKLKIRTLLALQNIIKGETQERQNEIDRITTDLITYNKPRPFSGVDNQEVQYDKNFERMCATLCQHIHIEPKKNTVMEFYNAFEYVRDMLKAKAKATNAKNGIK